MTRVWHLNCAAQSYFTSNLFAPELVNIVCQVLLLDTPGGFTLVDCGPNSEGFLSKLGNTAVEDVVHIQLKNMGVDPLAIKNIILTHGDFDHCGAITHFPNAKIHLSRTEFLGMTSPKTMFDRHRFRAIDHLRNCDVHSYSDFAGEPWFGFNNVRSMAGLPDGEILLIPLPGHTEGQCGVAIKQDGDKWLFHVGDSYFNTNELSFDYRPSTGLKMFEKSIHKNYDLAQENLGRLRHLNQEQKNVTIFCAHCKVEFDRLSKSNRPDPTNGLDKK
jgi:glyoxylase-like metal-dependent hydrolase (beta-lactamase superfamily II)